MVRAMRWTTFVLVAAAACGPTHKEPGNNGGGGGGGGDVDADVTDAYVEVDAVCGAQQQNIGVVNLGDPPDLLVVLDRSGSMNEPPITFPPTFTPKWQIMRDALEQVTAMKDMNIRFGLMEFPSDDNCAADANPEVAINLATHTQFNSYFATRSPGGNTPAFVGLESALSYYNTLQVNQAGRYVLFATDGLPNCSMGDPNMTSNPETVAAVTALKNAGIPTYVLGFGTYGLNTGVLDDAAVAGGKAKPQEPKFYEANNAMELEQALQAISGGIIVPSCSFQLMSAPPDPNNVTVTVNGMVVPRSPSHMNGWDYYPDAMTITFFGSYCQTIKTGANSNVGFVYGCPGPVIQ